MQGRIVYRCPSNGIEYYFAGFRSADGQSLVPVGALYIRPKNSVIFDSKESADSILHILVSLGYSAKFERLRV